MAEHVAFMALLLVNAVLYFVRARNDRHAHEERKLLEDSNSKLEERVKELEEEIEELNYELTDRLEEEWD